MFVYLSEKSKMSIVQPTLNSNIVAIKWHKRGPTGERPSGGALEVDVPALAIASDEGHIQLLKKEVDLCKSTIDMHITFNHIINV